MGDPVDNNLTRGLLGSLNCVLLRIAVQEEVQLRNLGNPAAIDFPVELNREPHSYSLPSVVSSRANRQEALRMFLAGRASLARGTSRLLQRDFLGRLLVRRGFRDGNRRHQDSRSDSGLAVPRPRWLFPSGA